MYGHNQFTYLITDHDLPIPMITHVQLQTCNVSLFHGRHVRANGHRGAGLPMTKGTQLLQQGLDGGAFALRCQVVPGVSLHLMYHCLYVFICAFMCLYVFICVYLCLYVFICVYMCLYVFIRFYKQIISWVFRDYNQNCSSQGLEQ